MMHYGDQCWSNVFRSQKSFYIGVSYANQNPRALRQRASVHSLNQKLLDIASGRGGAGAQVWRYAGPFPTADL